MTESTLYVVATPIGNLKDLTERAIDVLSNVDFIAAEDTRVTTKILRHLNIRKPLVSYYQHNMRERGEIIISRILAGESCAICTDAGTPAISDPGEVLVRQAIEAGIHVVPVPGCCAVITALSACGLATGRFCFEGFLPVSKQSRRDHLNEIKSEKRTMVFYEAPHKLRNTLNDLYSVLGDRTISICRELTKIHEEISLTTLESALEEYSEREPRGEYVLVVKGCEEKINTEDLLSSEEALKAVDLLVDEGTQLSEACRIISSKSQIKRSELYKLYIDKTEKHK